MEKIIKTNNSPRLRLDQIENCRISNFLLKLYSKTITLSTITSRHSTEIEQLENKSIGENKFVGRVSFTCSLFETSAPQSMSPRETHLIGIHICFPYFRRSNGTRSIALMHPYNFHMQPELNRRSGNISVHSARIVNNPGQPVARRVKRLPKSRGKMRERARETGAVARRERNGSIPLIQP